MDAVRRGAFRARESLLESHLSHAIPLVPLIPPNSDESHLSRRIPLIPTNPTYPDQSRLSRRIPHIPANPTCPSESHLSQRIPPIPANPTCPGESRKEWHSARAGSEDEFAEIRVLGEVAHVGLDVGRIDGDGLAGRWRSGSARWRRSAGWRRPGATPPCRRRAGEIGYNITTLQQCLCMQSKPRVIRRHS